MSSNIVTDDAHNWGAAAKVAASMKIKYPVAAVASSSYAFWGVVEIAQSSAFNLIETIASVSGSLSAAASARRMVFV